MWMIELETRHFSWRAFGRTEPEARNALRVAWVKHCQQTGADPFYINASTDGTAIRFAAGDVFRDDTRILTGSDD